MISVKVELVGTLQRRLDKKRLSISLDEPTTIMALAQRLGIITPSNSISPMDGEAINSSPSVLILVNGKEISVLNGLNTILEDDASVTFLPVSHGG